MKYLYKLFVWLPVQLVRERMFSTLILLFFAIHIENVNPILIRRRLKKRSIALFVVSVHSAFFLLCYFLGAVLAKVFGPQFSPGVSSPEMTLAILTFLLFLPLISAAIKIREPSTKEFLDPAMRRVTNLAKLFLSDKSPPSLEIELLKYVTKYQKEELSSIERVEFLFMTLKLERALSDLEPEETDRVSSIEKATRKILSESRKARRPQRVL